MSVVGKRSPVSTTTIRPSYSTTVMFLPISPRPPSGRTRKVPLTGPGESSSRGLREHAVALEHRAHGVQLLLVELDVRQAWLADGNPDQTQRGLQAAGQRGDAEVAVYVLEAGVDLVAALGLVDHATHLVTEDVAGGEHATGFAEVEDRSQQVVVAGVDHEAVDGGQVDGVGLL